MVALGLQEDTFNVVRFHGDGGINRCFRMEAMMTSARSDIDLAALLQTSVFVFSEGKRGTFVTARGYIAECELLGSSGSSYHYRAVLVPKLWFLTRTSHNQIFLNKTTPQILEELLLDGGLLRDEFEFRLSGSYERIWEYVCQYNESHFSFFSRWLEREGLYFFLESSDNADKLIITDSLYAHQYVEGQPSLLFRQESGLEYDKGTAILNRFTSRCSQTPEKVTLKDYNYRHPLLDLTGNAVADKDGRGEVYRYGDHIQTQEESRRLAQVYAEEMACRKQVFTGTSNALFLRPGVLFKVSGHFRNEYNTTYLVTEIRHEGRQPTLDYTLTGKTGAAGEHDPVYCNHFTAIPASVQYRPPQITERPRFHGVINACIDASTAGEYPELDSQGRYKVQLPFDLSGREGGKASAWMRMAQPYIGSDHGMHFPLKKGTEVLLTFIDGDPNRPIIAAAVPNPQNPSQVTDRNATLAGFSTPGGAQIVAQNQPGKEQITVSQGEHAHLTVAGDKTGSHAGIEACFTWQNASAATMAIAKMFLFNYSCSCSVTCVGYKRDKLGFLGMFEVGTHFIGDLAKEHGGKFPYVQATSAATALVVDYFVTRQVKKIVSQRLKDNVREMPQIGYGIMADATGATTYMKAPWKPSENRPDIAIVSSTGSIDIVGQKTVYTSAGDMIIISSEKHGKILFGDTMSQQTCRVPSIQLDSNKIAISSSKGTTIAAGGKIGTTPRSTLDVKPDNLTGTVNGTNPTVSFTAGKSTFKITRSDITFKGTKIRLG